jgi:general stress protein 26
MDGEVTVILFGDFWVAVLHSEQKIAGYWSSGLVAWVPSISDTDVTIWATAVAATEYCNKNRGRMLSARIIPADLI